MEQGDDENTDRSDLTSHHIVEELRSTTYTERQRCTERQRKGNSKKNIQIVEGRLGCKWVEKICPTTTTS